MEKKIEITINRETVVDFDLVENGKYTWLGTASWSSYNKAWSIRRKDQGVHAAKFASVESVLSDAKNVIARYFPSFSGLNITVLDRRN